MYTKPRRCANPRAADFSELLHKNKPFSYGRLAIPGARLEFWRAPKFGNDRHFKLMVGVFGESPPNDSPEAAVTLTPTQAKKLIAILQRYLDDDTK